MPITSVLPASPSIPGSEAASRTFADGGFTDRRATAAGQSPGVERRQFAATRDSLRPEVNELAEAIDEYKLQHRRRFITVDELFDIVTGLGYGR